ncbi:MAG: type II toxin-antitoxin system VapC family toxin [Opitutales bacterium]
MFIDTNILLEATDRSRAHQKDCQAFLEDIIGSTQTAYTSGQVFREYAVVATRPIERNGLGLPPESAVQNIDRFRSFLFQLEENIQTTQNLLKLVKQHTLSGKRIHDAQLVAVMLQNGIETLVTYNPSDFACFKDIRCKTP